MNCDDFLDALTSSDEGRQTAARWHANSCPSCAALAKVDAGLKKELAASEPLPQRMRGVWETVAKQSPQTMVRRTRQGRNFAPHLLPLYAAALAAMIILTVMSFYWQNEGNKVVIAPGAGAQPAPAATVVKTIDASAELDKLLAQVNSLEAELKNTSKQADLVDVRREADLLLATYSHW